MKLLSLIICLVRVVGVRGLSSSSSPKQTTIAVCTGADCRVDGASDALRQLQRQNANQNGIRVTGKPCLGPCGDGPCVMVLDQANKRVVEPQDEKLPGGSLVPPDLFGTNPRGIYQVRTAGQAYQVSRIAQKNQQQEQQQEISSNPPLEFPENPNEIVVQPNRTWFDRPRNERKVLQRFMQFLVILGVYQYNQDHNGVVGNLQYTIAAVLFVGSDVILKEGLFYELNKQRKKLLR